MDTKVVKARFKRARSRYFFREWRKYRGLTQERLAERVDMTPASISQLETAKQGFSDKTLESLAEALQCSPGDLLMRNPLDQDAAWDLSDQLKRATLDQRKQVRSVVEALLKTG